MVDIYQQNILDHYKNPRCSGHLKKFTGQGQASNLSCGDAVNFEVRLEAGVIKEAGWHGQGCVLSQAAASILAENITGKKAQDVEAMDSKQLTKLLGITPGPNRLMCARLALDAVKKALVVK